jgi:hypothetical protein
VWLERPRIVDDAACVLERILGQGDVPAGRAGFDAAGPRKPHEGIEDMFAECRRDLRVGEQPLQLARPPPIEAQLDRGVDQQAQEAGTDRQLQVQQEIEAPASQGRAQTPEFPQHCGFIEGDKLDLRKNRRHQFCFEFADDPGKPCLRPCGLKGAQHRDRVAGVADRRETQQADALRRGREA